MNGILRRLRSLIGDKNSETWDDTELLDVLNESHQYVQRYLPLRAEATRTPGGFVYQHFYSDGETNWADDVALTDGSFNDLTSTASVSDLVTGHWQFDEQPNLPMYATGTTYDIHGAAADLLEAELATLRRKFDTTNASGASMKRNQEFEATEKLIAKYRGKQKTKSAPVSRFDTGNSMDASQWAGRGGWQNVDGSR